MNGDKSRAAGRIGLIIVILSGPSSIIMSLSGHTQPVETIAFAIIVLAGSILFTLFGS